MNKKLLYFAPETEVYVLQNEGSVCAASYHQGGGGTYDDDDENDNGDY